MTRSYTTLWRRLDGTDDSIQEDGIPRRSAILLRNTASSLTLLILFPCLVFANPEGGQVIDGAATISSSGKVLTVNQTTDRAILQWQSFENTATESIRFTQPDANSVALNRVIGVNPSFIGGELTANGRIFLINPNGIVFGPSSQVNVGSLVASTLDISNTDFMSGNYNLLQKTSTELSSVVNQGKITVTPGGHVALVAPIVDNSGEIVAAAGRVFLVAGRDVTITPDTGGLINRATNYAGNPVRMAQIGFTELLENVVNVSSISMATRVTRLDDGTVFLRGAEGILVNSGSVKVDNDPGLAQGPGSITVDALHSVALGPGSRLSAVNSQSGVGTGPVRINSAKGSLYYARTVSQSHDPALVQGDDVTVRVSRDILSDPEKSLRIKARNVDFEATNITGSTHIGTVGSPIQVTAATLRAVAEAGESVVLDLIGDTRLSNVKSGLKNAPGFYTSRVILTSSGSIFQATSGNGVQAINVDITAAGQIGEGEPPPPPPPPGDDEGPGPPAGGGGGDVSKYLRISGNNVKVQGQTITAEPIGGDFFLKGGFGGRNQTSSNDQAADLGNISQPVARGSYSPPVDAPDVEVDTGSTGNSVIGSRDNTLQATLRNSRVRSTTGDGGVESQSSSSGGLIEVEGEGAELDGGGEGEEDSDEEDEE